MTAVQLAEFGLEACAHMWRGSNEQRVRHLIRRMSDAPNTVFEELCDQALLMARELDRHEDRMAGLECRLFEGVEEAAARFRAQGAAFVAAAPAKPSTE